MLRLQRIPLLNLLPLARNGAPYPKTVVYGDVVKGLPVTSATADLVYCSHTLEHLSLGDCRIALRESFRLLRAGGIFRAVLPDIKFICTEYLEQAKTDPASALTFIDNIHMGTSETPHGIAWIRSLFSRSVHLWMWDYAAMEIELKSAGFSSVRRAVFGDSTQAAFVAVESEHRWINALGFEAVK